MVKPGDIVRFLNTVGGGCVKKVSGNIAYVEDEDGFETPVLVRECVVVGTASAAAPQPKAEKVAVPAMKPAQPAASPVPTPTPLPEEEELEIEETPQGEKINLVLGYEPRDLKRLSSTTFDTYIVNDSNYYLYFSYLTRANDDKEWTARYAGVVEPNIQLFVGEVSRDDLPSMDRVAVQYIAFKRGKSFALKRPASVEFSLDTTKFAKLHCFRDNTYFDLPVLSFEIVTNDAPHRAAVVDKEQLEEALNAKKRADRRPAKRRVVRKQSKADRRGDTLVVDLHIGELVDNIRGLSNADMLNLQVDEFARVMDENLHNKGQKIVFIHGKGEGVLRNAIMKELNHRYKGHDVQDASFREYGFGATQVTIR